jgi:hypothetical protein
MLLHIDLRNLRYNLTFWGITMAARYDHSTSSHTLEPVRLVQQHAAAKKSAPPAAPAAPPPAAAQPTGATDPSTADPTAAGSDSSAAGATEPTAAAPAEASVGAAFTAPILTGSAFGIVCFALLL